ncbi:translocation and assembly module lipoprotein TamL [Flavobacterium ardleyense]|uniref:translocation and assembly module lipoprotein TamL n=1 Tax=Flavobacterium ardleyense TaxID=2038737 RepID=UPI00298C4F53|nr:BamA/TamA family outer membrane protein [Flavobacterium ardleyense]
MRTSSAKISLIIVIAVIISACNAVKRVPEGKQLLVKNKLVVNEQKSKDDALEAQLYQKPNSSIFGYKLRLNLYNLANPNPDSTYQAKFINNPKKYERLSKILSKKQVDRLGKSFWYSGIHNFLKKTGEVPVIVDTKSTQKSQSRLRAYYFNKGFFDVKATSTTDTVATKKAEITYTIETKSPYYIDSLNTIIASPVLDSLFNTTKASALLKSGKIYETKDFEAEKDRITTQFRNTGVFQFQQNYVRFDIDTVGIEKNKANVDMIIDDFSYRVGDSTKTTPFKIFHIKEVNIFTTDQTNKKFEKVDSTTYKGFNLYSNGKQHYSSKSLTNPVFITKDGIFADYKTTLTSRYLSNLRVFNYPTITYEIDKSGDSLVANILLVSRPKYSWKNGFDITTSNIQEFGISGNSAISIRNVFNGAEILELSGRGNIGSSKDFANPNDNFFNVSEYGADIKLTVPRIIFPVSLDRIVPKNMLPATTISFGIAKQNNIGLDKENFTGIMSYNWTPKRFSSARLDLFNIQYVNNVNIDNYFKVYKSSYNVLNNLAHQYPANPSYFEGNDPANDLAVEFTPDFIGDVLNDPAQLPVTDVDKKTINNIEERRLRLTENNLIFATSFSFSKTSKTNLNDNDFHLFRTKIESAGNLLSLVAGASNKRNDAGKKTILDVAFSQYIKTEFEFIKHWEIGRQKIIALRGFAGIAIPYGNSESIPFSRSYFAGGSNDNRAWKSYGLGPGSVASINDFNEANFKLAFNAEYRFNLVGGFNAALFVDAGNIWNALDNVTDERAKFDSFKSLADIAVGSGFGVRYDFSFFVVRLDLGFKTYNPAELDKKWFRDYNFGNSVLNIGINYPF